MCGKVKARKLRGGNEDDQCNFSSLVSFDWRSTIDTFDIKCTGGCWYGRFTGKSDMGIAYTVSEDRRIKRDSI